MFRVMGAHKPAHGEPVMVGAPIGAVSERVWTGVAVRGPVFGQPFATSAANGVRAVNGGCICQQGRCARRNHDRSTKTWSADQRPRMVQCTSGLMVEPVKSARAEPAKDGNLDIRYKTAACVVYRRFGKEIVLPRVRKLKQ